MIATIISLLFLAILVYAVVTIINMVTLPDPARLIFNVLLALGVLIYVSRYLGLGIA